MIFATRRRVEGMRATMTRALDHISAAEKELRGQLAAHDGFPSSAPMNGSEGIGRASGPATSTVERAALRGGAGDAGRALDAMRDDFDLLVSVLNRLDAQVLAALPSVSPPVTCNGGVGREGAHVWGHAPCGAVAHKLGMCAALYMAERRWRAAEGLSERES